MLADSLQEVQTRIFSEVLNFEEIPFMATASTTANFAASFVDHELLEPLAARKARSQKRVQQDIALGTVPGDDQDDVKLAVLVQNQSFMNSGEVEQISRIAKGELKVIFIGRQKPFWTKTRQRPLNIGCSVSPTSAGYSGTLGFFGLSNTSQKIGIVSNNHVLANVNSYPLGTVIVQQADGDGGRSPAEDVATLSNIVPIQFGGVANAVDTAFAELAAGIPHDAANIFGNGGNQPPVIGTLNKNGTVQVLPGLDVMKTGRTTGHTTGRVRAINVNNYVVNMGPKGMARFDGQIVFEAMPGATQPFSRPGDSGSLICDLNGVPVALLFAGSLSGGQGNLGITGGNPISSVLSQLGVTFA